MSRIKSLLPIVSYKSRALILGSMPGEESLRVCQYYANPRNNFWQIMGVLFGAGPSLPYQKRVALLKSVGIALWDTLGECIRKGSLDASIKEGVLNDFPGFFKKHPSITHVFFNGERAERDFRRYASSSLTKEQLLFERLPSTSSARAMTLDAKVQAWCVVREVLSTPS